MADEVCRYCGNGRHPVEQCRRVASIEYEPAGTTLIKRVTFHPPTSPEVELTKAFFGDPNKPRPMSRRTPFWSW